MPVNRRHARIDRCHLHLLHLLLGAGLGCTAKTTAKSQLSMADRVNQYARSA